MWFAGLLLYNLMSESTELYRFVRSLFTSQGKELSDGSISIEMASLPRFIVVRIYEDKDSNRVEVAINGDRMGYFETYNGQGLKYAFHQYRRSGMSNRNLTSAERFIEDTCKFYRDEIRLFTAHN